MRQEAATSFVVALDAGTTGVRALLVDGGGAPRAEVYREVLPACPAPGGCRRKRIPGARSIRPSRGRTVAPFAAARTCSPRACS